MCWCIVLLMMCHCMYCWWVIDVCLSVVVLYCWSVDVLCYHWSVVDDVSLCCWYVDMLMSCWFIIVLLNCIAGDILLSLLTCCHVVIVVMLSCCCHVVMLSLLSCCCPYCPHVDMLSCCHVVLVVPTDWGPGCVLPQLSPGDRAWHPVLLGGQDGVLWAEAAGAAALPWGVSARHVQRPTRTQDEQVTWERHRPTGPGGRHLFEGGCVLEVQWSL